jgi:hypothetical protein
MIYTCPKCGLTTYTADSSQKDFCPNCDVERYLIFNPNLFSVCPSFSNMKFIIDRRKSSQPVENDRREETEIIPVAWLVVKNKRSSNYG